MHYKLYNCVRKHFRVSYSHELRAKDEPGYHPLQNVNWALGYLRSKAQLLWNPGEILCLDEDRVKSRSMHNAYKTREPDKPIKATSHSTIFDIPMHPVREDQRHRRRFTR